MRLPFHRLAIGLAKPGDYHAENDDTPPTGDRHLTFMAEFGVKKTAVAFAATIPEATPRVEGYLFGRRDRGWTVIGVTTPPQRHAVTSMGLTWPDALRTTRCGNGFIDVLDAEGTRIHRHTFRFESPRLFNTDEIASALYHAADPNLRNPNPSDHHLNGWQHHYAA